MNKNIVYTNSPDEGPQVETSRNFLPALFLLHFGLSSATYTGLMLKLKLIITT